MIGNRPAAGLLALLLLGGCASEGTGPAFRAAAQAETSATTEAGCGCKAGIRAERLRELRDGAAAGLP